MPEPITNATRALLYEARARYNHADERLDEAVRIAAGMQPTSAVHLLAEEVLHASRAQQQCLDELIGAVSRIERRTVVAPDVDVITADRDSVDAGIDFHIGQLERLSALQGAIASGDTRRVERLLEQHRRAKRQAELPPVIG